MKQTYTPPQLVDLGSVRELTLAAATGQHTDQAFPQNTPFSDLTFS